jgi:hypothetical protein
MFFTTFVARYHGLSKGGSDMLAHYGYCMRRTLYKEHRLAAIHKSRADTAYTHLNTAQQQYHPNTPNAPQIDRKLLNKLVNTQRQFDTRDTSLTTKPVLIEGPVYLIIFGPENIQNHLISMFKTLKIIK